VLFPIPVSPKKETSLGNCFRGNREEKVGSELVNNFVSAE
jgi:hypothetical protein